MQHYKYNWFKVIPVVTGRLPAIWLNLCLVHQTTAQRSPRSRIQLSLSKEPAFALRKDPMRAEKPQKRSPRGCGEKWHSCSTAATAGASRKSCLVGNYSRSTGALPEWTVNQGTSESQATKKGLRFCCHLSFVRYVQRMGTADISQLQSIGIHWWRKSSTQKTAKKNTFTAKPAGTFYVH